jgi:hypothetical protein
MQGDTLGTRWQTFSLFALSELVYIFPFLTIGISMYQKWNSPYFILFPTFSPQAYSLLERSRWTDRFQHPLLCSLSYFFFHWGRGALPTGATLLGWPNYGVDGRLNKFISIDKQCGAFSFESDHVDKNFRNEGEKSTKGFEKKRANNAAFWNCWRRWQRPS